MVLEAWILTNIRSFLRAKNKNCKVSIYDYENFGLLGNVSVALQLSRYFASFCFIKGTSKLLFMLTHNLLRLKVKEFIYSE